MNLKGLFGVGKNEDGSLSLYDGAGNFICKTRFAWTIQRIQHWLVDKEYRRWKKRPVFFDTTTATGDSDTVDFNQIKKEK